MAPNERHRLFPVDLARLIGDQDGFEAWPLESGIYGSYD